MAAANTIFGPGFSVDVPPGFTSGPSMPAMGVYRLFPPGVSQFNIEAMIQIRPLQAMELPGLLQALYSLENPMMAMQQCVNLGLSGILGMQPARQVPMAQGPTHIREFDAMNFLGLPLRVMVVIMIGQQAAVETLIMMTLYNWAQYIAPCMDFLGRINLAGVAQPPQQVVAVVDKARKDQVEYRLVGANEEPVSLTALPTNVGGTTIINVDTLIQTGNINGTGIAVGAHSIAKVKWDKAAGVPS